MNKMQMPDIPQPPHFDELCRQIGCVVMQAQFVESSLARYLVLHLRFKEAAAIEEVHRALASADRKTLGTLLKRIEEKCPLPQNLADRLSQFCDDRNWLVHRLNREHPLATFQESEAIPVFQRILNLAHSINDIMQALDGVGDKMMSEQGYNPSEIKFKALKSYLRKAGRPMPNDNLESPKKS